MDDLRGSKLQRVLSLLIIILKRLLFPIQPWSECYAIHSLPSLSEAQQRPSTIIKQLFYSFLIQMIGPKVLYFTVNLMSYSVHALHAQFLVAEWRLSMSQIGSLSAVMGVNFVGAVGWSRLADRTGMHRTLLVGNSLVYAGSYCLLAWTRWQGCLNGMTYVALVTVLTNLAFSAIFPLLDSQVLQMLQKRQPLIDGKREFGRQRVWGTLGHALITLLSTEAVERWGYKAMFVLLVVTTAAFIGSLIMFLQDDKDGNQDWINYAPCKFIKIENPFIQDLDKENQGPNNQITSINQEDLMEQGFLMTNNKECNHVARQNGEAFFLHCNEEIKHPCTKCENETTPLLDKRITQSSSSISTVLQLLTSVPFLSLLFLVLCTGYTRAILAYFQPYYVSQILGKGNRFVSWAIAGRVISEATLYWSSGAFHDGLGAEWMLLVGEVLGLTRLAGYAFLPTMDGPWFTSFPVILTLELLKGASTSLTMASSVRIASDMAPPGGEATAQGIYSGVWSGLSMAMGGLLGAWIIAHYPDDERGLHGLFVWSVIGVTGVVLFYITRATLVWMFESDCQRSRLNLQHPVTLL